LLLRNVIIGQRKPKFAKHNSTAYHKFAVLQAESLKSTYKKPELAVDNQLRGLTQQEVARNRGIIKAIAEAIHLCGSQGIALRGHRDDATADEDSNKGNFLAILHYAVRSGNTLLAKQLTQAARNATYTSKTTQNQLISAIGDQIRDKLLKEIKEAKYYSILCDEVSDVSNEEQLLGL